MPKDAGKRRSGHALAKKLPEIINAGEIFSGIFLLFSENPCILQ